MAEQRFNVARPNITIFRRDRMPTSEDSTRRTLPRRDIWDRLLSHRSIDDSGCWNWTASRDKQGYGHIANVRIPSTTRETFSVHRLVAHLVHGLDIHSRNTYACHHCDNPACFNPEHIYVGTPKQNALDCKARGRERHQRGEENGGGGKLKATDIPTIRQRLAAGETQQAIGADYGVDYSMIGRIKLGKAWTHV